MSVERGRNAGAFSDLDERHVGVWVVNLDVTPEAQHRFDAWIFCPEEVEQWLNLPDDLSHTRVLRLLDSQESLREGDAYVKALGAGLELSRDAFQAFFRPGEAPGINVPRRRRRGARGRSTT